MFNFKAIFTAPHSNPPHLPPHSAFSATSDLNESRVASLDHVPPLVNNNSYNWPCCRQAAVIGLLSTDLVTWLILVNVTSCLYLAGNAHVFTKMCTWAWECCTWAGSCLYTPVFLWCVYLLLLISPFFELFSCNYCTVLVVIFMKIKSLKPPWIVPFSIKIWMAYFATTCD